MFESDPNQAEAVELDLKSDYEFDLSVYSRCNFDRIVESIRTKGRGHFWDFFDPEDLANKALRKLWRYTNKHRDCCHDKERIEKVVSTIVVRIWIDEVRRELKKRNLRGSGTLCVSLFDRLDSELADSGQEFEIALRELLEHVKAELTPRQKRIVDLRITKQEESEIALKLGVSESTIDREMVSIRNKIVASLAKISGNEQRTTNNEQRTTNNEQRTTNNEQRTTNNEVATRLEEIVLQYFKIVDASHAVFSSILV